MSTTPAATVRAARSATGRDRRGAEPTQAEGRARAGRSRSRSASPGPGHTADEAAGGVNDARPASDQADAVEAHNAAFILEDMQQRRGEATNHGLTDARLRALAHVCTGRSPWGSQPPGSETLGTHFV